MLRSHRGLFATSCRRLSTKFDFTSPVDRSGTACIKHSKYSDDGRDIIPAWVADMDFRSPPAIADAIIARASLPAPLGYTKLTDGLVEAVLAHLKRRYDWEVQESSLVWMPSLRLGLNLACRAFAPSVGDTIMCCTPVYPPFLQAPANAGRRVQRVPLLPPGDPTSPLETSPLDKAGSSKWRMDIERMEREVTPDTALLLLCNPHNPVGRAYSKPELEELADFCERHGLTICSDEIHADLVLGTEPGEPRPAHLPIAKLVRHAPPGHDEGRWQWLRDNVVTMMAPSKTFNVPGLGCSFAVIESPLLRARWKKAARGISTECTVLGMEGCRAAFGAGSSQEWHAQLLDQLRENRDMVYRSLSGAAPRLRLVPMEATYLYWIDATGLGLDDPVAFFEEHGVGLSDGRFFGSPGWVRMNFAMPPETLAEALKRMLNAVQQLDDSALANPRAHVGSVARSENQG